MGDLFFKIRSFVLFYIFFFIIFFTTFIFKSGFIMVCVVLGLSFCTLFMIRILNRGKKLKNLYFFDIEEVGYKKDAIQRGDQLGDVVAILIFLFLIISLSLDNNAMKEFGNNLFGLTLFCSIFYFVSASISITKNSKALKVITILLSTIQGILFLMITMSIILLSILNLFEGRMTEIPRIISTIFNNEYIVMLCFIAENSLKEMVVIMMSSIILLLTFIFISPPYQIEEVSLSFKIVNLLIVILSIIIFFYANIYWESIQQFIDNVNLRMVQNQFEYDMTIIPIQYITKEFSKKSITNMGYILILPYTLGAIIANLSIDFLKKKYNKEVLKSMAFIVDMNEKNIKDKESLHFHEKRYFYYGGNKYMLKIFKLTCLTKKQEQTL